jgi:hypothetical protein
MALFSIHLSATNTNKAKKNHEKILKDIYNKLNLSTFRNSLYMQRTAKDKYFSNLNLTISQIKKNSMVIDTDDWAYTISIIAIKDVNKDGITDIAICFTDKAKSSTYHSQEPLLITKYSKQSDYIALKFEIDGCDKF